MLRIYSTHNCAEPKKIFAKLINIFVRYMKSLTILLILKRTKPCKNIDVTTTR